MENIWNFLKQLFSGKFADLLCALARAAEKMFDFLAERQTSQAEKQKQKQIEKAEKKIDDACDTGDLSDLFDAAAELKKAKEDRK